MINIDWRERLNVSPPGGSAPNCTTHIQADVASFGRYSFYVASFYFRSPSFVSSDFPDTTEVVPKVPDAELLIVWSNAMRRKACVRPRHRVSMATT